MGKAAYTWGKKHRVGEKVKKAISKLKALRRKKSGKGKES